MEETKDNSARDEIKNYRLKASLLSSQISPIFDRLGRMMVDLAPHFAISG